MATLKISENQGLAHIRMNRPDVRNAFDPEMLEELRKTFSSFENRKDIRCVLLSGEGKVFSAGADLSWMKTMVNYNFEQNRKDARDLFQTFEAMMNCPVPVVGLVHGAAFGGALGLMACCDDVIAEKGTSFCFSEVKLGIAPAVISSFILRKATLGIVHPLMVSGRVFGPELAQSAGLVHHISAPGQGLSDLQSLADSWLEAGPEAARETKKLLLDLTHLNWEEQKDRTTKLIAERRVSSEGQEGLKSFLEKRSPSWRDL